MAKLISVSLCVLAAATVAFLGFAMTRVDAGDPLPLSDGISDYLDSVTLDEVVEASELIVIGELVDEKQRREPYPLRSGQASGDYQRQVERIFEVRETLRGESRDGNTIRVTYTAAMEHHTAPHRFVFPVELPPVEFGGVYVLFLRSSVDGRGRTFIGAAAEPGLALVQGDRVEFQATDRYRRSAFLTQLLSTFSLDAIREAVR